MIDKDFPPRVGPRTLNQVRGVLMRAGRPLSIPEIAKILRKSYPTVKRAVEELPAEFHDGHPKRYSLQHEEDPQIGDAMENVLVPLIRADDWVDRWNSGHGRVAGAINKLTITPEADPRELAGTFLSGAQTMASLAYALEQVADSPDWYERLGGEYSVEETDDPELDN